MVHGVPLTLLYVPGGSRPHLWTSVRALSVKSGIDLTSPFASLLLCLGRCESPSGRAEDVRLEAYACLDQTCSGLCLVPTRPRDELALSSSSAPQEDKPPLPPSIHGSRAQQGAPRGPEDTSSVAVAERRQKKGLNLSSLRPPLSEVYVGAEANGLEVGDPECLTCDTCGVTSRRAGEAQRESKGIQELLKRGKAFEEAGEDLGARRCFEQALRRAETWLHRGNWVLSEIYSTLTSVCVGLQVRCATDTMMITRQRVCLKLEALFFLAGAVIRGV